MGKKYKPETAQRFFDKHKCFEKLGFTGDDINVYYQEWEGHDSSIFFNDFLWSLFNKAIMLNGDYLNSTGDEEGFYFNNFTIYSDMARFRREEGAKAGVINKFLKLAQDSSHQRDICTVSDTSRYEVVVIGGHCCSYCDQLKNTSYDLEDYNRNPRLDATKCTR